MRVALVHDWLTGMRGGERVLVELCRLFPQAPVFTLFHRRGSVAPEIESHTIHTSFLDRIPGIARHYRVWLPLYPRAAASLDLRGFDLIVSSSHAAAKAVRKPPGAVHVCYCFTPMRYIWDAESDYFHYGDGLGIRRAALSVLKTRLRAWDRASTAGVDRFVAISRHVADRVARCYGRSSEVVYPPVDTQFFTPGETRGDGPYLLVAALVPPKRVDLALDAFERLGRPLVIVGTGPDRRRLGRRAPRNVRFAGRVSDTELRELYRSCRGLVVAGREDFGLTAIEAQACGRGTIAYGAGGSVESVAEGETGVLFQAQTPGDLAAAVVRFEGLSFDPARLRASAERFSAERFRTAIVASIESAAAERPAPRAAAPAAPHASRSGAAGSVKRALDVMLALALLALGALPMLALAAAIRLHSPGRAFFFQRRVGLDGRGFTLVKLRTMVDGAETATGPTWAVHDDPRVTRLGGFLRRWGLDELPQLWNVLRGDMSLVGPRPERPEFVAKFAARLPRYRERLAMRPGLTGLAQVRGWRGDSSLEERLRSDLEYAARWSLPLDATILLKTPMTLGRRRPLLAERRAAEG